MSKGGIHGELLFFPKIFLNSIKFDDDSAEKLGKIIFVELRLKYPSTK